MEWFTNILEAIRSYPLESLGATVGGLFVTFGGWKGLSVLFDLVFSKTKKTISKINTNVGGKVEEIKDIFEKQVDSLKGEIGALKSDLIEFKELVKELPKSPLSAEMQAYINAVKQSSSDLAMKYEKELAKIVEEKREVVDRLIEIPQEVLFETEDTVKDAVNEVKEEVKKIKVKRKK